MKIALVHDYLSEFGGAERVLLALSEMYPEAPIYTAFLRKNSEAHRRFKGRKIIESKWAKIPFFRTKLYSPLRFLAPLIWKGFEGDLSSYDMVISSASWYVTKGFGTRGTKGRKKPVEICYCHTPPRWLYGYRTSVEWRKFWVVRVYGNLIGYFMRKYDYLAAQKVNVMVANSKEVQKRIAKFYRRRSKVIYPPVSSNSPHQVNFSSDCVARKVAADKVNSERREGALGYKVTLKTDKRNLSKGYYLIISRLVGGKGLELAIKASKKYGFNLKIAGEGAGWGRVEKGLRKLAGDRVEWLGRVSDEELVKLYTGAKAFLALAEMEDFGITPVEAMSCGTPVIAFRGGGYLESVIEGKTGVFFDKQSVSSLGEAVKTFEKIKIDSKDCVKQASKFSKKKFISEMDKLVRKHGK